MSVRVYNQKGKGFQARVSHQGRSYTRGGKTQREALKRGQDLEDELRRAGPKATGVAPRFADYCNDIYLPDMKAGPHALGKQTYANRFHQVTTLVLHFRDTRLNRINEERVKEFQRARTKDGVAPATVNDDVAKLRRILNHAREGQYPVTVPKVQRLKEVKTKGHVRAWTSEQLGRLFAALKAEAPDIVDLVTFCLNTGCRKTEAIRLRWESVHWDTGQISIEPNEEWAPKNNKARTVPMNDVLRKVLARLRRENEERENPSEFVFVGERGEHELQYWPQNRFDRARKAAKLVGGPHTMRHTYATHFLAAKGEMFELARILGHSNAKVTELYSHMLPGALAKAGARVSIAPGGIGKQKRGKR